MTKQTIYLAPNSLHLPLYERILSIQGSCLGVSVLTLESYISRSLSSPSPSKAEILYQYRQALESLPCDNPFYSSRGDYDFLSDCYEFMMFVQLYKVEDFPKETKREQELYEIIERILPIELWVKEAAGMQFPDAKNVRILPVEMNERQRFFVCRLIDQGAQMTGKPAHKHFYYWSASNPRKEMEACADSIVLNHLEAGRTMIALSDQKEQYVLAQALEARGIPFTSASPENSSKVADRFKAAFSYLKNPSDETMIRLLKALFPDTSYDVCRFYEQIGTLDANLQQKTWRENTLVSQEDFAALQALEGQAAAWKPTIDEIRSWTVDSFDAIASMIEQSIPEPDENDLISAQAVRDLYEKLRRFISGRQDLDILIRSLDTAAKKGSSLKEWTGVLIGSRSEISPLFDNIYYIGADAASFPGSVQKRGIFGEEYLAKLAVPSLEERMSAHLDNLKDALMQPETVTFLTPQSDYMGSAIEASHELTLWLGQLPAFKAPAENSVSLKPSFSIHDLKSESLFSPENGAVRTRIKALDTYQDCPLKNLLRYGLRLKTPPAPRDYLKISGSLVPALMQKGLRRYDKEFYRLSEEEITALIEDDFSFARELFLNEGARIDQLVKEAAGQMQILFRRLAPVSEEMKMNLEAGNVEIDLKQSAEGISIDVQGGLVSPNPKRVSFNLYADQEGFTGDFLHPQATLDLSLQPKPQTREAFRISYGRGAGPATASFIDPALASSLSEQLFLKNSMAAQAIENPQGELSMYLAKKVKTYQQREDQISRQAGEYAKAMSENEFRPRHTKTACVHCPYRVICRNAARERGEQA